MTNEIDWTKAPEGTEIIQEGCSVFYPTYIKNLSGDKYTSWNTKEGKWQTFNGRPSESRPLINRPKPLQPVFTKAMQDNNELPPVGSEVEFETTFFTTVTSNKGTCEIIAYFGGKVWLNVIDIDFVINLNVIDFKPITPPVDLIDGKAYQFDVRDKGGLLSGIYSDFDKKLHVGPNHYFDLLSATNIKLLEVKS